MTHIQAFAKDLSNRERGPVAISTIVAVFTNLGNPIVGDNPEAQRETARAILRDTEGLVFDAAADTVHNELA